MNDLDPKIIGLFYSSAIVLRAPEVAEKISEYENDVYDLLEILVQNGILRKANYCGDGRSMHRSWYLYCLPSTASDREISRFYRDMIRPASEAAEKEAAQTRKRLKRLFFTKCRITIPLQG